jgi:type II restriction/modification system DNA methylase subunit YeeA
MDTRTLEKFARTARRQLHEQVAAKIEQALRTDSATLREHSKAVQKLKQEIKDASRDAVVERVAYTWFNRFCALRFMDVNHYTPVGVVSPAAGFTQPELLQEAKQGQIDDSLPVDRQQVLDLLSGRLPARAPQQEAYRLLLVAACNGYHGAMPFLFEPIADYTELLMPDDLLSEGSILQAVRDALTPDACQDEEVIGWLYQFYIAEKKEAVDEKVKAGGKVAVDELPAKTSLYTPDWIVRFLVENSLGRLWLLNRPQSKLAERMHYSIRPEQAFTDFVRVTSPEELRVADSAAGSGHMLLYAFDLLYAIYEEEGYNPPDIPRLILTQNLYGMEIDERSAALAAFALTMKARRYDRRFLRRGVRPNICVLHSVQFTEPELSGAAWLRKLGANLIDLPARDALLHDLAAAARLSSVGSLLRPQLTPAQIERVTAAIDEGDDLFTQGFNDRVRDALAQVAYLARGYHVVVANPPYLGSSMNDDLKDFARDNYPDSKADLFAMFMERNLDLATHGGLVAMITMQSWMFLSSYEKLRAKLLDQQTLLTMAHLGAKAFDSIGGEVVSTTAFVVERTHRPDFKGSYVRLVDGNSEAEKEAALRNALASPHATGPSPLYRASATDFKKIPGAPIAYWVTRETLTAFEGPKLEGFAVSAGRCKTHNDEKFVRFCWEIGMNNVGPSIKWKMLSHGGEFRRWYGNRNRVFDWTENARNTYSQYGGLSQSRYWNTAALAWSDISSKPIAVRLKPADSENSSLAPTLIPVTEAHIFPMLGYLNSKSANWFLAAVNSTFHSNPGDVLKLPYRLVTSIDRIIDELVVQSKKDWDSYETSWDFTTLPLLRPEHCRATLAAAYASLRAHWQAMTDEMQRLEEENNRIFIDAYGLQDELTPDVPLHEITLTCNPHYRYSGQLAGESGQLEARLLTDTMRELISYAVGCMFGRYSLDKPGLILANAGETVDDYVWKVARGEEREAITFMPDRDNVLPILDGDWFADDIVERCKRFLRVTFGEAHFSENLAFVEQALGRDLRSYFLRDFYDDHVKRYQKRPIYWLFSSPKGSFNALIYMHRYRPDTVSVVLNDYLRDFRRKLEAHKRHLEQVSISAAATPREKSAALKEIGKLEKSIAELTAYESDVLYPLATQQVALDLDDGVKVNYNKLGRALRKIVGVSG